MVLLAMKGMQGMLWIPPELVRNVLGDDFRGYEESLSSPVHTVSYKQSISQEVRIVGPGEWRVRREHRAVYCTSLPFITVDD